MNLHPRWKRLVEPLELTFQSWKEAAHLARHHCAKASAMLGAKRQDSLDILRSPESMALLSAGYFVPESHPFVQRYPGAEAVRHLIQGYNDNDSSVSAPSSTTLSTPSSPTCSTSTPSPLPPPCNENNNSNSNNDNDNDSSQQQQQQQQQQHPPSPSPSINASQVKPEPSIATTVTMETNTPNATITKAKSPVQPSPTLPPQKEPIAVVDENAATDNNTNETATDKTLEKLSAEKSNDDKPLEKPTNTPLEKKPTKASPKAPNAKTIKTSSTGKSKPNKNSICYRIPKEHTGVNLGFLDVQVNDKSVKALLSKIHWYVSAISLECAKRLDLEMTKKKESIKTTVFSLEEPIGIVQLPINNHHIPLYVLPMIYNGKVDLVLGSDFFNLFSSTLNIKARAIHFMDKETPYSVSHL
jgi:hypothetical protein